MARARTARGKWVVEGLRALADGGPEAVRIELIAQALGVSKGGFYGYFTNREALLGEVLDAWEREVTDTAIEQVEQAGGDARAKLARLFAVTPDEGSPHGIGAELTIREWARRDETVAARLRRVDNRRTTYLRSLFAEFCTDPDDIEARCMIANSLRIGAHLIFTDHNTQTRPEIMTLTTTWLLR
jgi:AcrR family transcriptional regulator